MGCTVYTVFLPRNSIYFRTVTRDDYNMKKRDDLHHGKFFPKKKKKKHRDVTFFYNVSLSLSRHIDVYIYVLDHYRLGQK